MKKMILASLLVGSTLLASDSVQKAVHHCDYDDDQRFEVFMATILHHVESYNESLIEYDVQMVINGACTKYISKKHKDAKFVSMLQSRMDNYDIKLSVCKSGMKGSGVNEKDVSLEGAELVPNGSAKLTDLQNSGFAYIKTW